MRAGKVLGQLMGQRVWATRPQTKRLPARVMAQQADASDMEAGQTIDLPKPEKRPNPTLLGLTK